MRFSHLTILSVVLATLVPFAAADQIKDYKPVKPTLSWLNNLEDALEASKKSGKPILLEFR